MSESMIVSPLIFWPVLAAIFAFVTAGLVANFRRMTASEKRIRDLAPLSDEWREQAS